jgi:hypothetical protein
VIGPDDERRHRGEDPRFGDSITVAFGDAGAEVYGVARVGATAENASAIALLFGGRDLVATEMAAAEGAPELEWDRAEAGDVRIETVEPLARWRAAFDGDGGGFELELTALSPPIELSPATEVSAVSGTEGYEQLCHVTGTARIGERRVAIDCLGQRGHQWGIPDWEALESARTVSAWLGPDSAVIVQGARTEGSDGHDEEALTGLLLEGAGPGAVITEMDDPRLSTTFDAAGRQRRAGMELWVGPEDEFPRRVAGEALCGTSLELGRLRLDSAFFLWRSEGRTGVGRYELLRRA